MSLCSTPTVLTRRQLLALGGSAAVASLLGTRAWGDDPAAVDAAFRWDRSLVVIELRGGNDALNMVIPYADDAYPRLRPTIHLPGDQLLALDDAFAFHPGMAALKDSWQSGDLGIAHGLGYDHPNRSHFRGIDIWNSASRADETLSDGWVARILAKVPDAPPHRLADGIILGFGSTVAYGGFGPLYGQMLRTIIMDSPAQYIAEASALHAGNGAAHASSPASLSSAATNPALAHILKVERDITHSGARMAALINATPPPAAPFPATPFGTSLKHVAHLISAGATVPFYKITLDGFDTHANQRERQDALLTELSQGLAAFRAALIAAMAWNRTLVMTYSEFGRRVAENGSAGTDHGTAAAHLLLGGLVKGGHLTTPPSLRHLDDGDLIATTDFKTLYATCAAEWWGWPEAFVSDGVLPGLGCIKKLPH